MRMACEVSNTKHSSLCAVSPQDIGTVKISSTFCQSFDSNCLLAVLDGKIIGFTHYRPFASTLRAINNGFLDDLFVDPATRGSGAAQALIDAVADKGRENS